MNTAISTHQTACGPRRAAQVIWLAFCAAGLLAGCAAVKPAAPQQEAPAVNNLAQAATDSPPAPALATEPAAVPEPRDKVVHFHFDSSLVDTGNRDVVTGQTRYLVQHPEVSVILEGYADERGSEAYNMKLGLQRALSVAFVLEQHGIEKNRIRLVSYGEEKPVAAGHSEAAWQQNRRVEIHYQPDSEMVSTLPAAVVQ